MQEKMQLGQKVEAAASPDEAEIQCVPSPRGLFTARFTCTEFTSLCPVTGQPDFATIVIDYAPDSLLIESKSLKLFLQSFRNHGAFHESCTVLIGERLMTAAKPHWLRVSAFFEPRGGIPIDVFWQAGELPMMAIVPDLDHRSYRGRQ